MVLGFALVGGGCGGEESQSDADNDPPTRRR